MLQKCLLLRFVWPWCGLLRGRRSLHAQAAALTSAWQWRASDSILHALPLHHIHGIVNALYCPLAVGARVEFATKFSPAGVWERLMVRGEGDLGEGRGWEVE